MELLDSNIEKAAGAIIGEDGFDALTLEALSRQMNIAPNKLRWYIDNDEGILKFLAQRFEKEIRIMTGNLAALHHEPGKELTELFRSLYDFFNRKPYYLDLMFADLFHVNDTSIKATLLKIREDIRSYLIQILNYGKKSGTFNPNMNASYAADSVINNFRFFMSDIPLTHKMILDLKKIREKKE